MAFTHRTLKNGKLQVIGLGNHSVTLEEFQSLFPSYTLDAAYCDREYQPGECHFLKDEDGNLSIGPRPWPDGDIYLQYADEIAAVVDARRHGQAWAAIVADPKEDPTYKVKIMGKQALATAAGEKLKSVTR